MSKDTTWKEGESGNPSGRPPSDIPSRPRSQLRNDLTKYRRMMDDALSVIQRSIDGEKVARDQLSSARFIIDTITSVQSAAVREERDRVAMMVQIMEQERKRLEYIESSVDAEAEVVEEKGKAIGWNPPVAYTMTEEVDGE